MHTRKAYCSACDRDVLIAEPDETEFVDSQANIRDPEIVCLEIGHRCTGAMCPVAAQPPAVMAVRLVRSGLDATTQPHLTAHCSACGQLGDFVLVDPRYVTCATCGTTTEYARLETAKRVR